MKMKTVLLGAVSLLIVGGAVAGVFVLRNQKTAAAKELVDHDSLAARTVPSAPQGASGQAMPDSATMRSLAAASAADSQAIAQAIPPAAPPAAPADSVVATPVPTLAPERIARLFGNMEPKEAATVLEKMTDADVTIVLASLRDRQAAAILSSLPPERAARITQGALHEVKGR